MFSLIVLLVAAGEGPSSDPLTFFTSLGAFAAAAAVGLMWIKDIKGQRDRAMLAVEAQTPILVEIRDVMRSSHATLQSAADAMSAMSEALKTRIPTEADITRMRDALDEAAKRYDGPTPRRRE